MKNKKTLIAIAMLISGITLNGMIQKITNNSSEKLLNTAVGYFLNSEKGKQLIHDAKMWNSGTRRQQEGLKIFNPPEKLELIKELSTILND